MQRVAIVDKTFHLRQNTFPNNQGLSFPLTASCKKMPAWSHGTGTQSEVMAQAHSLKSWHRHTAWSHGTGTQPEVMAQAHNFKSWHRHTTSSHGTGTQPQVMMCVCMCVCMRACAHVCGVQWIQYYVHIMIIFGFNVHIFVDLVKSLVSEIWRYRNDIYYYYTIQQASGQVYCQAKWLAVKFLKDSK